MEVEVAIAEYLAAEVASVAGRVYQLKLPQRGTLPAIRVQLITEGEGYHLRGGGKRRRARVQIDYYAAEASGDDPYADVIAGGDEVHDALNGAPFTVGSPVTMEVTGCFRITRTPMYEPGELRQVREMQEWIVWSKAVT